MSGARTSRDWEDTQVVANFLRDRNPFEYGETFCNLSNGVHANASVNALQLVNKFWKKWLGKSYPIIPSKGKTRLSQWQQKVLLGLMGKQVDTQLLFQRLIIAAKTNLQSAL